MALRPCKECKKEISTDAKICPHCGKKQGIGLGIGCLGIIVALIALGYIGSLFSNRSRGGGGGGAAIDAKQVALSQVKLDYNWRKVGFDNVMEADFTVKNNSNYNVKDFEIKCTHFARSGTEIDSNTRTIYDIVKAHSTKKFPNFNMGFIHPQAASSSCQIVDLSVVP
jgi:hypothetical protein